MNLNLQTASGRERPSRLPFWKMLTPEQRFRFRHMRYQCKRYGKIVPTFEQLWQLRCSLDGDKCPHCQRTMLWKVKRGQPSKIQAVAITLQHNRDGTIQFLCQSCNAKHYFMPDDSFYAVPNGAKWCNLCERVLPLTQFHRDKSLSQGKFSYCKECEQARYAEYRRLNRDKCLLKCKNWHRKQKGLPPLTNLSVVG